MAQRRGLDWLQFHVVGEGSLAPDKKALLHWHGAIANEEMPALLSQMHVCVALTHVRSGADRFSGGSGVSNALLEQMAAKRIIVAWDNPAFRQVVDESSAYLVRQGDRAALLEALVRIHAQPVEARARAERAAQLAERYSFDSHMDQFASAAAQWVRTNEVKAE